MRVIYIAGKFRAPNYWEQEQNIREAEEIALQAWQAGFAVVCPHANTRFFQGAAPDNIWLQGDIEIMKRCDAVLTVDGWRESMGAKEEVRIARELGIPVYENIASITGSGRV